MSLHGASPYPTCSQAALDKNDLVVVVPGATDDFGTQALVAGMQVVLPPLDDVFVQVQTHSSTGTRGTLGGPGTLGSTGIRTFGLGLDLPPGGILLSPGLNSPHPNKIVAINHSQLRVSVVFAGNEVGKPAKLFGIPITSNVRLG